MGRKQGETIDKKVNKNGYTTVQLPLPAVPTHFTRPRRSIMRLAALNTRRASGLRARTRTRAIIVLDRWGHRNRLLRLPRLDAGGCGSTPASSESALSPPVDAATRALRPTSFPARPAVTVGRRWRTCQRRGFGFRAGMSFGLGCQFAREDFRPSFERTADVCLSG